MDHLIKPYQGELVNLVLDEEQAEQLKEFALAHQLRNILAMEQEHAMDLRQALGK